MISITKRSVPDFLRSSAFCEALDEEDEEIMIPKACFVRSTDVASVEDLSLLLSTLRYWGVNEIPQSAVKYTMWHKPTAVIHSFAEFQNELTYVKFLESLCVGTDNANASTCKLAAKFSLASTLRFLYEHGCPWNENCCENAARAGSLECLRYAHEHGCPSDSETCTGAVIADSLPCLQYAHENGGELKDSVFAQSTQYDTCRAYLLKHCCPQGKESCAAAAEQGDLPLLISLRESGCEWDAETCQRAA
jgi:hypothetical protein